MLDTSLLLAVLNIRGTSHHIRRQMAGRHSLIGKFGMSVLIIANADQGAD